MPHFDDLTSWLKSGGKYLAGGSGNLTSPRIMRPFLYCCASFRSTVKVIPKQVKLDGPDARLYNDRAINGKIWGPTYIPEIVMGQDKFEPIN